MRKTLLFLLLLLSTFSFSQTEKKVSMINGLPATGNIIYNDSFDENLMSSWFIKIDIRSLDNTISINSEYKFGMEELVSDDSVLSFFYQYDNDGNVIKVLTLRCVSDTKINISNIGCDSATLVDYCESNKKLTYNIQFIK